MQWLDRNEIYVGRWRRGQQDGPGRQVYLPPPVPDEDTGPAAAHAAAVAAAAPPRTLNWYDGQFAAGERHGAGAFHYADGSTYAGEWARNGRHGMGRFVSASGTRQGQEAPLRR
jgi:hypothetical protein